VPHRFQEILAVQDPKEASANGDENDAVIARKEGSI
jgi:hypothetical protein